MRFLCYCAGTVGRAVPLVNRPILLLAGLLAGAGGASAADLLVAVSPITDDLVAAPKVAADAVVVGFVGTAGGVGGARSVLAAIPPAERGREVCLRVQTGDGLYTGAGVYAEPEPGRDALALLPYETVRERIYGYPAREVAVLVYPCSSLGASRIALAAWGAGDDAPPSGDAELLVNSFRADRVFVALPDDSIADCAEETAGSRAAFDFRCPIPLSAVRKGGQVAVYRARGESLDAPVAVDVIGWE